MPYLFAIIAIVIVANFYMLFKRSKRGRNVGKDVAAKRVASVKNYDDLKRKLDFEQQDAIRRIELRKKTWEMYEQVRKQAEEQEKEAEDQEPEPDTPENLVSDNEE